MFMNSYMYNDSNLEKDVIELLISLKKNDIINNNTTIAIAYILNDKVLSTTTNYIRFKIPDTCIHVFIAGQSIQLNYDVNIQPIAYMKGVLLECPSSVIFNFGRLCKYAMFLENVDCDILVDDIDRVINYQCYLTCRNQSILKVSALLLKDKEFDNCEEVTITYSNLFINPFKIKDKVVNAYVAPDDFIKRCVEKVDNVLLSLSLLLNDLVEDLYIKGTEGNCYLINDLKILVQAEGIFILRLNKKTDRGAETSKKLKAFFNTNNSFVGLPLVNVYTGDYLVKKFAKL